ncbi:MAG: SDR family oxidoreductase [Rhizobiales bacterium]|nr:SDR family oxidoreductase [Hyphomicrobiales bacterium]
MSAPAQKVALVTGASSGIGTACAEALREEGLRVFTAQRRPADGFETVCCDLADPESPERVVADVVSAAGRLDVLINNAGMMRAADVEALSLEEWQQTLALNLTAPFLLIKHAVPHMRQSGGGTIVNIGSIEGLAANPGHPAYCASKSGLHGLTRAVAVDHGQDGIRCNAIAPGWIDTELNEAFINAMPNPDAFRDQIGRIHPAGRTGMPKEVAALAVWLCSDKAAFVTGQIYPVDGGRTAQLSLP